jgi:hypothetical protein
MVATEQLLPHLSNGHQVVLNDFGHTISFWTSQPEAADHLINHYYDTGEVDDSLYIHQPVDFAPENSHTSMAKLLVGAMAGFAGLLVIMLIWMPIHLRRRGRFGSMGSLMLRTFLVPVAMGLGGWFLAWLIVMTIWPSLPGGNQWLVVFSIGLPIGTGTYWAWVDRDWPAVVRRQGWRMAALGSLVGAWLGFYASTGLLAPATTILGAAITVNLVLILRSIAWERAGRVLGQQVGEMSSEPNSELHTPMPG